MTDWNIDKVILKPGSALREIERLQAAMSIAEPIGVRCTGCGSPWDDARLAEEKEERPAILSCCPERNMIPVYAAPPTPPAAVQALEWIVSHRAESNAVVWDVAKNALSAQEQDVAGEETTTRFYIEWIAAARPPVHPEPMTGRLIFETFDLALRHMKSQADDAQFVSLEERQTTVVYIDRSADMRAALPAAPAKQEG